jgi:ribosomal protein L7/L12
VSQAQSTAAGDVDRNDWDAVLAQLRSDGFSPVESIKVTRAVLQVSLGEAKQIVHTSGAWSDARERFEQVQDAAESAAHEL